MLLPRAELDVTTLHLPPVNEEDLPGMVANAVAAESDETATPLVTDFVIARQIPDESCPLSYRFQVERPDGRITRNGTTMP